MLKDTFPIAVGTPNRINKLIELGALSMGQCSTVVLDVSLDAKKFQLLSLHETKSDVYAFISSHVVPELEHMKISVIQELIPTVTDGIKKLPSKQPLHGKHKQHHPQGYRGGFNKKQKT